MEWMSHELFISGKMIHWAPVAILSILTIILIVGFDLMGVSRNDCRLHHKGTQIGAVGIALALVYTVLLTVYQLFIV
jgi:hypothetical protein